MTSTKYIGMDVHKDSLRLANALLLATAIALASSDSTKFSKHSSGAVLL